MFRYRLPVLLVVAAFAVAAVTHETHAASNKPTPIGAGNNWPAVGGAADESSYSQLDQINTRDIDKLGLAWSLDLPGEVSLEGTPLEVDGTIYFTGSLAKVYAADAKTGALKWTYDPQVWKHSPDKMHFSFGANRGMAYEDGKVFAAALDGRLFALDANTGQQLWVAESIPAGALNISTGAPRVMNGKVIIGNGGADFGGRGFVTAFDANTGQQLWRFYITPGSPEQNRGNPAMEVAAKTWSLDFWKHTGGGGTVWNGMTFDPELDRVYLGTGNSGPYDPVKRDPGGGDDLYNTSIVALDAKTGKYIWHYQENPRDCWDYKSTPNIIMATVPIKGQPHDVLLHAPTNGFFYVLERKTGKLLNEPGKTTEVSWAKNIDLKTGRPNEYPNIRYETGDTKLWPGTLGGHNWQAMSYDPTTGLAYIPIQQIGEHFSRHGVRSSRDEQRSWQHPRVPRGDDPMPDPPAAGSAFHYVVIVAKVDASVDGALDEPFGLYSHLPAFFINPNVHYVMHLWVRRLSLCEPGGDCAQSIVVTVLPRLPTVEYCIFGKDLGQKTLIRPVDRVSIQCLNLLNVQNILNTKAHGALPNGKRITFKTQRARGSFYKNESAAARGRLVNLTQRGKIL